MTGGPSSGYALADGLGHAGGSTRPPGTLHGVCMARWGAPRIRCKDKNIVIMLVMPWIWTPLLLSYRLFLA